MLIFRTRLLSKYMQYVIATFIHNIYIYMYVYIYIYISIVVLTHAYLASEFWNLNLVNFICCIARCIVAFSNFSCTWFQPCDYNPLSVFMFKSALFAHEAGKIFTYGFNHVSSWMYLTSTHYKYAIWYISLSEKYFFAYCPVSAPENGTGFSLIVITDVCFAEWTLWIKFYLMGFSGIETDTLYDAINKALTFL